MGEVGEVEEITEVRVEEEECRSGVEEVLSFAVRSCVSLLVLPGGGEREG